MTTRAFFKVCLVLIFSIKLLQKHTLDPEITILYQFHAQKTLFKVSKICSMNWHFSKDSSNLVAGPFPKYLSSISLSNVSFCVPILGTKNGTCLSDGPALCGFQKRTLTYSFLRGLAAPVIRKVRVLCYEFTDVTLAWEDGQWVEAHKIILAGCSPKHRKNRECCPGHYLSTSVY